MALPRFLHDRMRETTPKGNSIAVSNYQLKEWMDRWTDGWMDGWMLVSDDPWPSCTSSPNLSDKFHVTCFFHL